MTEIALFDRDNIEGSSGARTVNPNASNLRTPGSFQSVPESCGSNETSFKEMGWGGFCEAAQVRIGLLRNMTRLIFRIFLLSSPA
jgi:hypothetical protein